MPQPRHKIAILVESLGKGGAERSAGLLSKIFDELGHEVYLVTITDVVEYPHAGLLVNLGLLKNKRNDALNKLKRFDHFRRFLDQKKIDFVLDFRFRKNYFKEWLLANYLYKNVNLIYMVRSARLRYYFPKESEATAALFSKAFHINGVSRGIVEQIQRVYGLKNTGFIPNPVDFAEIDHLSAKKWSFSGKYIVAAGRMSIDVKQFDKLIMTYAQSSLPQKGIALKILGDGVLKTDYQKLATALNVDHLVHFEGFQENPFLYFKNALFTVLCSKFEGMPRVLLESLACGTPVIAMDCPTGPREIIQHEKNGLLLPENDFYALKTALNTFAENDELRNACAGYAKISISGHSLQEVGKCWQKLLNSAL